MTEQVLFRAGRALVVTLSALTLAHLLELSHRLAYDTRLWAQLTSPDALHRYLGAIGGGGLLEVATVAAVTVHAMTVGWQRPGGRFALTAAVLHTAAVGVWLGMVLPAGPAGPAGAAGPRHRAVGDRRHPRGIRFLLMTGQPDRELPIFNGPYVDQPASSSDQRSPTAGIEPEPAPKEWRLDSER